VIGLDTSTTGGVIDRLEGRGLLRRNPDARRATDRLERGVLNRRQAERLRFLQEDRHGNLLKAMAWKLFQVSSKGVLKKHGMGEAPMLAVHLS
jgi:hypothetical protein